MTLILPQIVDANLQTVYKFLKTLFIDSDSIALTCLNDSKNTNNNSPDNSQLTLPKLIEKINMNFILQKYKERKNICICPNPIIENQTRSINNVDVLNALFVDIDNVKLKLETLKKLQPRPHYIFARGEKHFHLYWLIKRVKPSDKNLKYYKELEEYLIQLCGGDRAVKDPARILRIPYSYHLKDLKNVSYYEQIYTNYTNISDRYGLFDLHQKYVQKYVKKKTEKYVEQKTETTASINPNVNPNVNPDGIVINFLKQSYAEKNKIYAGSGRSLELFFIGLDCHGWGLDEEIALALATEFNENKCNPPESFNIVQHQISSAYKYAKGDFGEYRNNLNDAPSAKAQIKEFKKYKEFQKIRSTLKIWVYVAGAERMVNLINNFELTTDKQIVHYIHYTCASTVPFNIILAKQLIRVVEHLDFRPDIQKRIYKQNIMEYLNTFRPLNLLSVDIDTNEAANKIKLFTDHLKYLTTTKNEYETLLNYFAYLIQNIGEKLPYAILIISRHQGIGKSILEKLFRNIYGDYIGSVENETLSKSWTHFLANKVLVFVHELAQGDKYTVANKFKNYITEPYVEIEGKYARPYRARNTVNFLMFSNEHDAIKLTAHDRRFFVINTDVKPKEQNYYTELVKMFDNDWQIVYTYLSKIDLQNFNPYLRPGMTEGKQLLIDQSTSELDLFLNDFLSENKPPFDKPVIALADIHTMIAQYGTNLIQNRASVKMINRFLIHKGYKNQKINRKIRGKTMTGKYWSKENLDEIENLDKIMTELLDLDNDRAYYDA